jgi:hypothetical protein
MTGEQISTKLSQSLLGQPLRQFFLVVAPEPIFGNVVKDLLAHLLKTSINVLVVEALWIGLLTNKELMEASVVILVAPSSYWLQHLCSFFKPQWLNKA